MRYGLVPGRLLRRNLDKLLEGMEPGYNFFEDFFGMTPLGQMTEIKETDDSYIFSVRLAGVQGKDIDVSYQNGTLNIKANSKNEEKFEEERDGIRYHTRRFGRTHYDRSWDLPPSVTEDNLNATFKDGFLEVIVKKPQTEGEPKTSPYKVPLNTEE